MKLPFLPLVMPALMFGACNRTPPVVQPIEYSHKLHVDSGIACTSCHESAETAAAAGVPGIETCITCHQAAITESAEEEKVRQYAEREEEIPWRRVHQMPDHVYFSHRRHVAAGGVECEQCHGAIANLTAPPPRPLVNQSMTWCISCHRTRGATQDCVHCHR